MDVDPQLVEIFREEADDLLSSWESILLDIKSLEDRIQFNELFRIAHTLKGSSKAVGFEEFGGFIHCVEDLIKYCQESNYDFMDKAHQVFLDAQSIMTTWLDHDTKPDQADQLTQTVKSLLNQSYSAPQSLETASNPQNLSPQDPPKTTAKPRKSMHRVSSEKIDNLNQIIGELSSQVNIMANSLSSIKSVLDCSSNSGFQQLSSALDLSQKYLQRLEDTAMSLAMQDVSQLFQRLERACHDVARTSGKTIAIEKLGADTEIDKTVLEKLADPFIHLVRNAVDHGIETPDKRAASHKPHQGHITISAALEAGNIKIVIEDDGKGIDPQVILKKAEEKGLIQDKKSLSHEQILQFILLPGFSTKDQVSEISGRGVGMDVVASTLKDLGGSLEIQSQLGQGSSFHISLPTNASLVESLIIQDGDYTFGLPLSECSEIIDLEKVKDSIRQENACLHWKNELISLRPLKQFYPINTDQDDKLDSENSRYILIHRSAHKPLGIGFDKMLGRHKLFIKPLKGQFECLPGISGTTILPNGSACLVLDISEISENFHKAFTRGSYVS